MTYIEREALLKEANQDGAYGYVDTCQIAQMPAADVVKVVRCRECKYWHLLAGYPVGVDIMGCKLLHTCSGQPRRTYVDDFCSYGEKRED